jgi:hypothetical protein
MTSIERTAYPWFTRAPSVKATRLHCSSNYSDGLRSCVLAANLLSWRYEQG